jgi:hypothetical protein
MANRTMTRADVSSAWGHSTHPHLLWAIPGNQNPHDAMSWSDLTATFKVDAGCVPVTLSDPFLTAYLAEKVPVLFACERKIDLRKFRDRRATLTARGYRLWGGAP